MKFPQYLSVALGVSFVLPVVVLSVPGCANLNPHVVPMANRDVAALDAETIVRVMQRAGFSDEQIVELGTRLRNSLAASGAAKVVMDEKVEAIFAVDGVYLHVSSRRRGSFIYDLKTRKFR